MARCLWSAVINFMNADINGTAVMDVSAVFGGCEITVPAHWKVQVDIDVGYSAEEWKTNVT